MSAPTLRWRAFRLPMRHRFEAAHVTIRDRRGVLVELCDGDGCRGVGEASPMPSLGGGSVEDVIALLERHGAALLAGSPPPPGAGVAALGCALDTALLDLEGRHSGRTVAALLAPEPAAWVQVNAVIGEGPPEEVARYGREALARGYQVLKAKVGGGPLAADVRRIAALRESCPAAVIRLDANGAWDEATALQALVALQPLGIELLEQPVAAADVDALARVRAKAPMRIAADEAVHDPQALTRILELRAADLLVLKPMLLGGLHPAFAVARRAAERGIGALVTTTFDSSIGTAASLHLAAALPTDAAHGLGTGEHLAADVTAETLLASDGRLALPTGFGLGIAPDAAALERVASGGWSTAAG